MYRLLFLTVWCAAILYPVLAQSFTHLPGTQKEIKSGLIHSIAVIKEDERTFVPPVYADIASGIGILADMKTEQSSACTAFCVAPNIIATNAHCIVRNPYSGKRRDLSKVLFLLPPTGRYSSPFGLNFTGQAQPSQNIISQQLQMSRLEIVDPEQPSLSVFSGNYRRKNTVRNQSQDWAIARLASPLCKGRELPFEKTQLSKLKKASQKNKVFMIGFHGDYQMKHRLISKPCIIHSRSNRKFFPSSLRRSIRRSGVLIPHTCDAAQGSSGSPIFVLSDKGPRVVGINLGSVRSTQYLIKKNRFTGEIIEKRKLHSFQEINMAVRPQAFLQGIQRFQKEKLLTSLEDFTEIQTILKNLKLYPGRVDGILGGKTRRAIQRFERKMDLAELGLPTQELLAKLRVIDKDSDARKFVERTPERLKKNEKVVEQDDPPDENNWDGRWLLSSQATDGCVMPSGRNVITVKSGRLRWGMDREGTISTSGYVRAEGSCRAGNCRVYYRGRINGDYGKGEYYTDNGYCAGVFSLKRM